MIIESVILGFTVINSIVLLFVNGVELYTEYQKSKKNDVMHENVIKINNYMKTQSEHSQGTSD